MITAMADLFGELVERIAIDRSREEIKGTHANSTREVYKLFFINLQWLFANVL